MRAAPARTLVPLFLAAVLGAAGARRVQRLELSGRSMEPTLAEGDRVLILRSGRLEAGMVAAVRDPRQPARIVVKRVAGREPGGWRVLGDNPAESTDSRTFGVVGPDLVVGRVVYRYHPPERAGRVRRAR